eukprot:GFUD01099524.1.p1 GENE.GFUD01099524.1~~GFUD01099524.1.p1  ORF type:complete len:222 (-),score=82.11 GFUD01099524.1:114-779(-)
MLRPYLLLLAILLMCRGALSIRIARDACDQSRGEFEACTHLAYNAYKAAFEAGDDGKPDWMARKACNYMTAAVEECGNKLVGECNSEQEVTDMKDHQLKGILMQLQMSVQEWDSEKCPAVKSHVDRMKSGGTESGNEDSGEDNGDDVVVDGGDDEEYNVVVDAGAEGDVEDVAEKATETESGGEESTEEDNEAADDVDDDKNSASSLAVSLSLMMALCVHA